MRVSSILRQDLTKSIDYCVKSIKTKDLESYYPYLLINSAKLPGFKLSYLIIKSLNLELASIQDEVSNAAIGKIKFNYWKDSIRSTISGSPPLHPVTQLLSTLPYLSKLSPYHFTRLITAREQHFLQPSFHDLTDLANYSAGTQASILYLLLQSAQAAHAAASPSLVSPLYSPTVPLPHSTLFEHEGHEHENENDELLIPSQKEGLKPPDSLTLDHAASHLAVVMTIAILLRSIPHHAVRRINVIPTVIASRHGLTEESLFRQGPNAVGLRESVATLVGIAEAELKTARGCFKGTLGVPEHLRSVFLTSTPAKSFLNRLASDQIAFNVFDGALHKRYWKLPFQVYSDSRKSGI